MPKRMRGRRRGRVAIAAALTTCVAVVGVASAAVGGFNPFGTSRFADLCQRHPAPDEPVDLAAGDAHRRAAHNGARLVSSTISPNGQYLAALGWNDFPGFLTIIDLKTGTIGAADRAQHRRRQRPDTSRPTGRCSRQIARQPTLWVPQSEFLAEVQLRRRRPGRPRRRHADLPVWEQRSQAPGTDPAASRIAAATTTPASSARTAPSVRRRQRRRAAVGDGALAGRVEALRRAQRRQQARRDRHRQTTR